MVILVYALETNRSIGSKIGSDDYSYYFVMKNYRQVLEKFGTVIEITNPEVYADVIYNRCLALKEPCIFFSFTPPFKTAMNLKCPTISVFAWEYTTIPTDVWGGNPLHDWRNVLKCHGRAITHSNFAVEAVKKAMGEAFPVWSMPAPVWDKYNRLYNEGKHLHPYKEFELSFKGAVIDFQGCADLDSMTGDSLPFDEKQSSYLKDRKITINLKGIIYTSVFNPNDGRKNWPDLLWGFIWAFREVEDATLVMKLSYYNYDAVRESIINEIKKFRPFKCRVIAIHGFLNTQEYTILVRNSSYIVNTAHGEGQCLPLMEFMSAGKPAIAPNHTAMEDYLNKNNAFVVESTLEWIPWPHDPRHALKTGRYRINWASLYHAYLESYQVAKEDALRYQSMSECAVERLKAYCSTSVITERLKKVIDEQEMPGEASLLTKFQIKLNYSIHRVIQLLKAPVNISARRIINISNLIKRVLVQDQGRRKI